MVKLWQIPSGAVVACEIYELFEHSGICIGEQQLVELHGSGLVRVVSETRFLAQRSGEVIQVFVNSQGDILHHPHCGERAAAMVYQSIPYDVIAHNCHRFTFYCGSGLWLPITSFYDLKVAMADYFSCRVALRPVR